MLYQAYAFYMFCHHHLFRSITPTCNEMLTGLGPPPYAIMRKWDDNFEALHTFEQFFGNCQVVHRKIVNRSIEHYKSQLGQTAICAYLLFES